MLLRLFRRRPALHKVTASITFCLFLTYWLYLRNKNRQKGQKETDFRMAMLEPEGPSSPRESESVLSAVEYLEKLLAKNSDSKSSTLDFGKLLRKERKHVSPSVLTSLLQSLSYFSHNDEFCNAFLSNENSVNQFVSLLRRHQSVADLSNERLIAQTFSNFSSSTLSESIFKFDFIHILLEKWLKSSSLHLNLCAVKILSNVKVLGVKDSFLSSCVYKSEIYELSKPVENGQIDLDIVFINGMQGSVFYSWRQHDSLAGQSDYTQCWPRDWLSTELPGARMLGFDCPVKPFISSVSSSTPNQKLNLSIRASYAANQLITAGVGKRPIIWVTHSFGGLLVKEILRLCERNNSKDDYSSITSQTKGIVFMGVPHLGARSLKPLYWYPFRFLLTYEACEVFTEHQILAELHSWFQEFSQSTQLPILTLVETQKTKIYFLLSTMINPEEDGEMGEVVRVPADHIFLSKPKSREDVIYSSLLTFIRSSCALDLTVPQ